MHIVDNGDSYIEEIRRLHAIIWEIKNSTDCVDIYSLCEEALDYNNKEEK
jgi:hypothetical protein